MNVQSAHPISSSTPTLTQANIPSSSHRLPTISATDALKGLETNVIPSGLHPLDNTLVCNASASPGGYERGKVHEIWGPSGAGKTALAVQAALEVIRASGAVTWIDASSSLSLPHRTAIRDLTRSKTRLTPDQSDNDGARSSLFDRFSVPTLSHLLAMTMHSPPSFPPSGTSLLIIDGLNSLIDRDYPRHPFRLGTRTEQQKWQASRRYAILGSLVSAFNRLAAIHHLAVLVTTGCSTRMRGESGLGAALAPGVGGAEWEAGIWSRITVFQDFTGRFLGVQKCQGRHLQPADPVGGVGVVVQFKIDPSGRVLESHTSSTGAERDRTMASPIKNIPSSPVKLSRKRPHDEIADSDDEAVDEYGWQDGDEDAVVAEVMADEHVAKTLADEDVT